MEAPQPEDGTMTDEFECPLCDGSGMMSDEFECSLCDGSGGVPSNIMKAWEAMARPIADDDLPAMSDMIPW